MEEIAFALDTFYAVMAGALVMFMAAGFTMLEAGLVQKKDVSEIVTKNIGLYSIACIMYLACGFVIMYPGSYIIEGVLPSILGTSSFALSTSLPNEEIRHAYECADFSVAMLTSEGSDEEWDKFCKYTDQLDNIFGKRVFDYFPEWEEYWTTK